MRKAEKREKLVEILRDLGSVRTMIFVEQKKNCDFIATYICMKGFDATSIHGDRLQVWISKKYEFIYEYLPSPYVRLLVYRGRGKLLWESSAEE